MRIGGQRLTSDIVVGALSALGLAEINKATGKGAANLYRMAPAASRSPRAGTRRSPTAPGHHRTPRNRPLTTFLLVKG